MEQPPVHLFLDEKSPQLVVDVIEKQVGVAFQEQGRALGLGLDCVGVVSMPLIAAGFDIEDKTDYNIHGSDYSKVLYDYVERNCDEITDFDDIQPSDILLLWVKEPEQPQHLGMLVPSEKENIKFDLIHSSHGEKKMVRMAFDERWKKHIHSMWRVKGMRKWQP